MPIPANCPAEVTVVIDMRTACHQLRPKDTAVIPNVKETDRYPSANGMPVLVRVYNYSFYLSLCIQCLG